jgi:hypothetical protein
MSKRSGFEKELTFAVTNDHVVAVRVIDVILYPIVIFMEVSKNVRGKNEEPRLCA